MKSIIDIDYHLSKCLVTFVSHRLCFVAWGIRDPVNILISSRILIMDKLNENYI